MEKRILLRGARQLLTLYGPSGPRRGADMRRLGIVEDGAVLIADGVIQDVGPSRRVENLAAARDADEISADGHVVMPGFVDAHTHPVGGPPLLDEYESRIAGELDASAPWSKGQDATARALRSYSVHRVEMEARKALREVVRHGTTTLEAKTGLALDESSELKALRVFDKLRGRPLNLLSTFCLASVPPPYSPDTIREYLDAVVRDVLPKIHKRRLAQFVDIRCGERGFPPELARRFLQAADEVGFLPKVMCDGEGGATVGVDLAAPAVGCLANLSVEEIACLSKSSTVAVLMPGAAFHRGLEPQPSAREMIDAGAAVAFATGFGPNLFPSCSMPAVLSLACSRMDVTPAEAVTAATINAAHAIGCSDQLGSLESGKDADLIMLNVSDYREIPYHFGMNPLAMCMIRGDVVYPRMEFS